MQIMPRIFTKVIPRIFTEDNELKPRQEVSEEVIRQSTFNEGDYLMVILKEFYIGDNREWWINSAEVNISFEFSTGTDKIVNKIFSTFTKVKGHKSLPIKNVVLLPPIQVRDHFSIALNVIELDASEATNTKSIMDTAGKVIDKVLDKVPIPGVDAVGSIVTGIVGDIVNLVASLNDDDVIIREIVSYLVQNRYPALPEMWLTEGELEIKEDMSKTKELLLDKAIDTAFQPHPVPERTPNPKGNLSDEDKGDKSFVKLLIVKAQPPPPPEPKSA
jgi:hypothetical protein